MCVKCVVLSICYMIYMSYIIYMSHICYMYLWMHTWIPVNSLINLLEALWKKKKKKLRISLLIFRAVFWHSDWIHVEPAWLTYTGFDILAVRVPSFCPHSCKTLFVFVFPFFFCKKHYVIIWLYNTCIITYIIHNLVQGTREYRVKLVTILNLIGI